MSLFGNSREIVIWDTQTIANKLQASTEGLGKAEFWGRGWREERVQLGLLK